jgi:hypothetical protein
MWAATHGMTRNPDSPKAPPSCSTTATNTGSVFCAASRELSKKPEDTDLFCHERIIIAYISLLL